VEKGGKFWLFLYPNTHHDSASRVGTPELRGREA
jgi:hypothetical protein